MTRPSGRAGYFVWQLAGTHSKYKAFVPAPLPPVPALAFSTELRALETRANIAVGRLDGITRVLPDIGLFIYMYVRKEAVLSSQIEGTQSSLSDLLQFERDAIESSSTTLDVEEVSRCVAALSHGYLRLRELPLSMRLLCEVHRELVTGARGSDKTPGIIRTSQNWIGGANPSNAMFVPPPPSELPAALSNLEAFLHDSLTPNAFGSARSEIARSSVATPPLIKAALAHAQFETIHPFLDGNGRVGRLLITLSLLSDRVLSQPVLYLSLHFKTHRDAYYQHLQRIRSHGDWEPWVQFFLEGVVHVAEAACSTIERAQALFRQHREQIISHGGRSTSNMLRVYDYVREHAVLSIPPTAKALALSQPTVTSAIAQLVALGILEESTGKQRDRRYLYRSYMVALAADDEP